MSDFPSHGWKGYSSPNHPYEFQFPRIVILNPLRLYALKRDDEGHEMREMAFRNWRDSTVMPQAVNRWIAQIGRLS